MTFLKKLIFPDRYFNDWTRSRRHFRPEELDGKFERSHFWLLPRHSRILCGHRDDKDDDAQWHRDRPLQRLRLFGDVRL